MSKQKICKYIATICLLANSVLSPQQLSAQLRPTGSNMPTQWSVTTGIANATPQISPTWWDQFNDTTLTSLITLGLKNNYNISMAMRRTVIARNTMQQLKGNYLPTIDLSAGWTKAKQSGTTTVTPHHSDVSSYFTAGLTASWQVDLFARISTQIKAKRNAFMASRADFEGTMVSICAQIASAYIQLRVYQAQHLLALNHTQSQKKIVDIAIARFETSLASKLDVAQAFETYYSTSARIPQLTNSIHGSINTLSLLTGIDTTTLAKTVSTPTPLPNYQYLVSTGVPADLLRRRPDIVEAERQLAEYAAEIGIAKKDFLPMLTVNGSFGLSAHNLHEFSSHDALTYSIAPTFSWTIFDNLSRKYALANARENFQIGYDNYNLVLQTAITETDSAIAAYFYALQYVDALNSVITQVHEELQLSIDRYKSSLCPMSDVVTAQLNALTAENNLIAAKGDALSALITLYEALGGGFDASDL